MQQPRIEQSLVVQKRSQTLIHRELEKEERPGVIRTTASLALATMLLTIQGFYALGCALSSSGGKVPARMGL